MEEIKKTPDTESEYLLEVDNLVKWFPIKGGFFKRTVGNVKAVDGVSFKIKLHPLCQQEWCPVQA